MKPASVTFRWMFNRRDMELTIRKDAQTVMFFTCFGGEFAKQDGKRRKFQRIDIPYFHLKEVIKFLKGETHERRKSSHRKV